MKILVADDEQDLRELITFCIQADYSCEILQAIDGRSAIAALDADPGIAMIICDFSMPNGDGHQVFEHLVKSKHRARFVLCSGSADRTLFQGPSFAGFIEKPDIFKGLKDAMNALLAATPDANTTTPANAGASAGNADSEWCWVRTDYLLKINLSGCDLFVRLSDQKFVKIMRSEDVFTEDDAARYAAKKVDRLWIRRADARRVLTKLERDLTMITSARNLDLESAFEISKMALDTIHGLSRQLGFTPQVQALTKASIDLAVKSITDHPRLADLFKKITLNPEEYLAAHSVALAHTACGIAGTLGWNSDYSFFKLSLAAFLHDLTLAPELSRYNSVSELIRANVETNRTVGADEEEMFMTHPARAADLVNVMKTALPDVELIIRQHHERPDGSGFPDRLNHLQISPLAAVMILAEDLVTSAFAKGPAFALQDFLTDRASTYSSGQFKKIACALGAQGNA